MTMTLVRTCRGCGCTDHAACSTMAGPCWWVDDDLCSRCAGIDGADVSIEAKLTLANFPSVSGLQPAGDTNWIATPAAGTVVIGAPGTGNLGNVMNGALESSNVNLTGQLVNMIIAQRNFGANAKTITANSEMAQTIIAIR